MVREQDVKQVEQWKKHISKMGGFTAFPVNGTNFVDVFHDAPGWESWSRVIVKPEFVRVVKGSPIHPKLLYRLFAGASKSVH